MSLRITGAAPGTVIDLAAAEHLSDAGLLVPLGQHAGLRYVCDGRPVESFESFDLIGTRYLHAVVRIPEGAGTPSLEVAITDHHRPRPEGASFACSDPVLERIHAVGLRTVDLCALDADVDCPTREQRVWTGDSVVHQLVDLTSNPDWSMAVWHPQLATMSRSDGMPSMAVASDFAADDRSSIPDWALHWVHSVHNRYRYTGDRDLVADLLPSAERTLRWFEAYLGDDGLLHDVTGWQLIDWASVYIQGCSSILNGLWARALEELAEMSRWFGTEGVAAWTDRRREGVRAGFDLFWDEGRGSCVDHALHGVAQRPMSQHGGAAALAAGLVPADRMARVVERITDRSRILRHSWVMDPVTPTGGSTGYGHLMLGYPEPEWDVEESVVDADPRPHRPHPRHHPGRARLRLGARGAPTRRPRVGDGDGADPTRPAHRRGPRRWPPRHRQSGPRRPHLTGQAGQAGNQRRRAVPASTASRSAGPRSRVAWWASSTLPA